MENVKDEIEELEEDSVEEIKESKTNNSSPKQIVITTVKGIIQDYKELMKNSNDEMLLKGFADENRNEDECVNYVMNNLTKQRIFGGRDSLMYPYIHDYYVDDLDTKLLLDNWSSQIGTGGSSGQQVRVKKPTEKDILEAYDALGNDKKNEIYQEQLKRAEEEAYKKAQEKIKAAEQKKKEKEAEKKKLEEERKAQEEANKPKQMSLFDF